MNEDTIQQLTTLHAELRACRHCLEEGYWIVPGAVFSGGAEAEVMLIGQAPGITEGQVKRPFNAGSGKRLFQWLGAAGWDEDEFRGSAYMTAVTKCYPGPNIGGKGDRVPTPFEQALCRPWLEQEIRLVNPRLILLVGGLAIKLLYPASTRLNEIIGTAAYFPPEALASNPLNFDLSQARMIVPEDEATEDGLQVTNEAGDRLPLASYLSSLIERSAGGRFVVPLPHPSGVSLWYNRPENKVLVNRTVTLLSDIRVVCNL